MSSRICLHRFIVVVWGLILVPYATAQNPNPSDKSAVLRHIASLQVTKDTFYHAGHFPTTRTDGKKKVYEDNTLFYAALIATTLQSLSDQATNEDRAMVQTIQAGVQANMERYRSRRGRYTYNFWQTNPDIPHPNGPVKLQQDKYKLPDDFDDTSILALLTDDTTTLQKIRAEMVTYTEHRPKKIKTTYRKYRDTEAYGVWFADQWEQELDIVVLSNTMTFVFQNQFELNRFDSASIQVIKQMIAEDLDRKNHYVISPYYPERPVILYHLARLTQSDHVGLLDSVRPMILQMIMEELSHTESAMHQLMLYTSLYKLGQKPNEVVLDWTALSEEVKTFRLFSANLMSATGTKVLFRKLFKNSGILPSLYWYCEAYSWTLVYEFLIFHEGG